MGDRISENYKYGSTFERINTAKKLNDDANEIASSGKKLRKVSDNPVAAIKVYRNRDSLENINQFKKNIDYGKSFLNKTESTLLSLQENLRRAKEISIQQSNNTYDDTAHKAAAAEVKQLIYEVISLGNSEYDGKYIFGGFKTKNPPISADGSYTGDDGSIFLQFDEKTFRPINVNGRSIFETLPNEETKRTPLLKNLNKLYESLENYDRNKLHSSMEELDYNMNSILTTTATLGSRQASLDEIMSRLEKNEIQVYEENGKLEGEDPVKSALDLKRAGTSLQFTMQASSKMVTPSLMEFLK